ncbi:PhzF family phenazine biosynthesis protein, partial [Streptomyces asoensis]|uniref:PhzF family phenazine biosynthesis protein n=1 Tax=Streptomyces asoensis TaxID=249586 RepID=UPI0033F92C4F
VPPPPRPGPPLAHNVGWGFPVRVPPPRRGGLHVYTPTARLPFADHSCVGVAWLLDVPELVTPAGTLGTRLDGEFNWIEARAEWAPPCTFRQYASAAEVDDLAVPAPGGETAADLPPGESRGTLYAWAWEDEPAGRIRARGFPARGDGVDEDEATGAAALLLTERLGRALNITQGAGSQILTAPQPFGWVELGGRVFLER